MALASAWELYSTRATALDRVAKATEDGHSIRRSVCASSMDMQSIGDGDANSNAF